MDLPWLDGVQRPHTPKRFLGHSGLSTTMIYTHVLTVAAAGTASPLDFTCGLAERRLWSF